MPPKPLTSFLRPLPGLASQQQGSGSSPLAQRDPFLSNFPIEGNLPTEEEIEAQRGIDNGSNFFFDLLALPSKILGFDAIKAALTGDLEQAAKNNPVSGAIAGISDLFNLGLKEKVGFEEVPFANIREAWGDKDADEGFLNGVLNFAGEVVLDPVTYLFPFGKLGEVGKIGDKAAGFLGKGAKTAATPVERLRGLTGIVRGEGGLIGENIAEKGAGLINSAGMIEAAERTALVFRLPFTDLGFFIRNKNMDLKIAHGLEALADQMFKNPLTAPMMKAFSSVPTGELSANKALAGNAPGRRMMKFIREKSFDARHEYTDQLDKLLNRISVVHKDLLKTNEKARLITFLSEIGVEAVDDASEVLTKIDTIGALHKGRVRRDLWLTSGSEKAQAAKAKEYGDALTDPEKMDVFMKAHPKIPLPLQNIKVNGGKPRHGIDFWRPKHNAEGYSEQIEGAVGSIEVGGPSTFGGGKLRRSPAREASEVMEKDLDVAYRLPRTRETVQAEVSAEKRKVWGALTSDDQAKVLAAVEDFRELGEKMATLEKSAGILNQTTLFYVPHELSPTARQFINTHIKTVIGSSHGDEAGELYLRLASDKKRQFADWTQDEVNEFYMRVGGKQSGYVPMQDLPDTAFLSEEAKMIDKMAPFLKRMGRKNAKVDPGSWDKLREFFDTNPLTQWGRRIDRASKVIEKNTLIRHALDKDAPWVIGTYKMSDIAQMGPEMIQNNHKAMLVVDRQSARVADMGSVMRDSIHFDGQTRVKLMQGWLQDDSNAKLLKSTFEEVNEGLTKSLNLTENVGDISQKATDSPAVVTLKQALRKIKAATTGTSGDASVLKHNKKIAEQAKESIRNELRTLANDRSKWEELVTSGRKKSLQAISGNKLRGAELDREFAIWRKSRETGGVTSLDELKEASPELYEKMLKADKDVVLMHGEIADNLFGPKGFIQGLYKVDPLGGSAPIWLMDKFTSLWKAWTVGLPIWNQTRIRDFASNLRIAMFAGVSPKDMALGSADAMRATKQISKYMKGDADSIVGDLIRKSDGAKVSVHDFIQEANRQGALNSSWAMDMMSENLAGGAFQKSEYLTKTWKDAYKVWDPESAIFRAGRTYANSIDNFSKQLIAQSLWQKGMTVKDAWKTAMKYSYDPRKALSATERFGLRRFIPFYTWTKFAVGTTTEAYFRNPGAITFWDKLHKTMTASIGVSPDDSEHWERIMPRFIRDYLGVPTNKNDDGTVNYLLFGGYMPEGNLAELVNAVDWFFDPENRDDSVNFVVGQMNPALKAMIEGWRNESAFTGTDIERYPGEEQGFMAWTISPKWANTLKNIRALHTLQKFWPADQEDASNLISAWRLRFEKEKSFLMKFATSALGFLPRSYKLDVERNAQRAYQKNVFAKSKTKGQMRKQMAAGTDLGEQEAQTLREILAGQEARGRDIEELAEPFLE